jgi:hypothetical protein
MLSERGAVVLLSELDETTDAALLGAVAMGDVEDDGGPVGCPTLAMALELWRLTGSLYGVASGLEAWRPGEPWAEWVASSWAGWCAVRPLVASGMKALAAVALVQASEARRRALVSKGERLLRDMAENEAALERALTLAEAACSTNRS